MASFESSDPQKSNGKSDSNVRLISLSSEVNFDWSLFDLFLKQHVSQWPNGLFCMITDFEKLDLDESTSGDRGKQVIKTRDASKRKTGRRDLEIVCIYGRLYFRATLHFIL